MFLSPRRFAHLAGIAALALSAACDPGSSGTGPDPVIEADSVVYDLVFYRGNPLPYFDLRTQENIGLQTLTLHDDGTFAEISERSGTGWRSETRGTYAVEGDSLVLRTGGQVYQAWARQEGMLRGGTASETRVYVQQGVQRPAEYRFTHYGMVLCNGAPLSFVSTCSGSYAGSPYSIYQGGLVLSDAGTYYRADAGPGATARSTGSYQLLSSDSIAFSPVERGLAARSAVRGDSLFTGNFVYVKLR
jgi:hypothetical protein